MSATDLQTQGQQAYKRGDFAKALQFFDRALGRQQTVKLYDYRAATYDKLNNLPAALQDAKKAIHTGIGDPTGYLRAGRILVKMEKPTVALEIYAHGLKKVQHVGQGYEQLKKIHDELQAQVAPRNSVDPMTKLPRELACIVLEYLNFRQRIAICRVSKGWQKFIRSEPNLWQHLDLSNARTKVKTGFISTAINIAKKKLTSATLSKLYDYDKVLAALVKHCPIERLTLAETPLQGDSLSVALSKASKLKEFRVLSGTDIGSIHLRQALTACPTTLEVFHCQRMDSLVFSHHWNDIRLPQLRSLDVTAGYVDVISPGLSAFLKKCPLLQTLRLHDIHSRNKFPRQIGRTVDLRESVCLQHVDLDLDFHGGRQLLLSPSIRTLSIATQLNIVAGFWPGGASSAADTQELRLLGLPELEEFHLGVPNTDIEEVRRQLAAQHSPPTAGLPLSKLRSLSLHRPKIDPTTFDSLLTERTKDLQSLKILECRELDDKRLLHLIEQFPKLRSLDVSLTGITGAGVKDVVLLGHIQELVLNSCHNLSRDAVDWARKQGVKVTCVMNNEGIGGKKVRY